MPATFKYPPNLEGAEWFMSKVLPIFRRSCPATEVWMVGAYPAGFEQLGEAADVRVTGWVEDIASVFFDGAVVIVPLLGGSGTRVKILEAWARGAPVVTTAKGASGLGVRDEVDALIASTPADFARACSRLVSDSDLRARLAENGRARLKSEYAWPKVVAHLRSVVTDVICTSRSAN
jgi:glycosyltransferase involved in cell wall biosynthesis